MERSRRPKRSPNQISRGLEGQIVKLRRQTGFGAERLQREFRLPCSHNAIARVFRTHQLVRPRKKKPATKKQLRAVKRHWKLFGQLSVDTKYLQDIPHYWPQMTHLNLPRFQYTVREPVSGACFTGYADELSKSYATLLAEQLAVHLAGHGVDLSALVWQTDNGGELLENQQEQGLPAAVRALGCEHRYIPPKRYTWQSDVETVHRPVEDEFFDRETFRDPPDFWAKTTTYWDYFNLVRPNCGKEWQSPLQILQRQAPALVGAVLNWRPLDLAKRHHFYLPQPLHQGHDVPSFPYKSGGKSGGGIGCHRSGLPPPPTAASCSAVVCRKRRRQNFQSWFEWQCLNGALESADAGGAKQGVVDGFLGCLRRRLEQGRHYLVC